ncbi:hypothetical protein HF320_03545 [Collinsella sp. KGMB02528]|uniref:Uncharacterized protein n=1 Tax=Collinsella acetigenes TaxID=2713419 RepID=A0A7X9UBE3_9ACTN|nr:hypothetical protein [Collinsella acetigenes]NMF55406.1 hypothetical protein [Collinsella acetigenes]
MGAAAAHFGIRYANDLTGEYSKYVVDSIDLLNAQLAPHDMSFFFDTIDVHQQIIGGKHCCDMFGWVVPNGLVPDFEPTWLAGEDEKLESYNCYVCASWEDRDGMAYAAVDGNFPEEAYA